MRVGAGALPAPGASARAAATGGTALQAVAPSWRRRRRCPSTEWQASAAWRRRRRRRRGGAVDAVCGRAPPFSLRGKKLKATLAAVEKAGYEAVAVKEAAGLPPAADGNGKERHCALVMVKPAARKEEAAAAAA